MTEGGSAYVYFRCCWQCYLFIIEKKKGRISYLLITSSSMDGNTKIFKRNMYTYIHKQANGCMGACILLIINCTYAAIDLLRVVVNISLFEYDITHQHTHTHTHQKQLTTTRSSCTTSSTSFVDP